MFSLVAGRAQSRGRSDEPIRTQRDRSASRDRPIASRRSKRRSEKESDSSNNYPPIIVGPLTTNQDLDVKGEKTYNLPLMIQQPFLREKKEPIKVDISVKLVPKPRKKERKRKEARVDEIIVDDYRGVINSISMEVADGDIHVLKETVEIVENDDQPTSDNPEKDVPKILIQTDSMETEENEIPEQPQEVDTDEPQTQDDARKEIEIQSEDLNKMEALDESQSEVTGEGPIPENEGNQAS